MSVSPAMKFANPKEAAAQPLHVFWIFWIIGISRKLGHPIANEASVPAAAGARKTIKTFMSIILVRFDVESQANEHA